MRPVLDVQRRAIALARRLPRLAYLFAGLCLLVSRAVAAQGGPAFLWRFSHDDRTRFTAMSMLTGTLRLRNALSRMTGDEQIYNGGVYTNWGFGAPMLQMPFHALALRMKSFHAGFFPDRAIFFVYLTALIPVLWIALSRLLASRGPSKGGVFARDALSGTGTLLILTYALFPLMSGRFLIYEETIGYMVVFELFALSAYIFLLDSKALLPIWLMGLAAGMGLLIRPTGLIYLGVWGLLVLLERRTKKAVLVFSVAALPFIGFWLYSNWVKTGSFVSFGYQNSMPWFPFHTPMLRFDDYACATSPRYAGEAAAQLFKWFFVVIREEGNGLDDRSPHLQACHFMGEARPPRDQVQAFFGLGVLLFLVWTFLHHVVRRERRLAIYVPFATVLFLFVNFVRGPGFAWRYCGDFWPVFVLVGVDYVRSLPHPTRWLEGLRLPFVLALCSFVAFKKDVEPSLSTIELLDETGVANLAIDFNSSRRTTDTPLPNHLDCGHGLAWLYHNGQGWNPGCGTDTFTNLFLGVPRKATPHYELRFRTEGIDVPTLRAFVNGRIYTAQKRGHLYSADISLDYNKLHAPDVLVTIEWTQEPEPRPGKLLAIELV